MKKETATAIKIIAALSTVYIASNFYRSSISVIAPDVMDEIGLTHEQLGVVGGIFFIGFAVFQIPVGIFLDRYGPRKTICCLMLMTVVSSFGFAVATSFSELTVSRFFIGVGCSPVMMGSLVIISRWLSTERFALYASLIVGMGGLGNIISTTPTALLASVAGWRVIFWVSGGLTALALVIAFLSLKDAPEGHAFHSRKIENMRDSLGSIGRIISDREFQYVFAINLVIYGTIMTIAALWGANFLRDIYGLDVTDRGNVLFAMMLAMICSSLVYGYLDSIFASRKRLIMCAATTTILILGILAALPVIEVWQISALLILLCFVGNYGVVIMAHGRSIFPEELLGRGIATLNTAVFLGVFLLQGMGGLIIGHFHDETGAAPLIAYKVLFLSIAAVLILAVLIYSRSRDSKSPKIPVPPSTAPKL